jgi:D-arabinose 1-dehydrogenase-like Zn-dependent alcohol dehydrogenase
VKDYLVIDRLKWKTFPGQTSEIFRGVNLHQCLGHTASSVAIALGFEHTGSVVLIGDASHVKENYELVVEKNVEPWVEERPLDNANQAILELENGLARYRYVLVNDNHV